MDPARKRRIRLVVALSAARRCSRRALVYTSFCASSEAVTPSRLAAGADSGPLLPAHRQGRRRLGHRHPGGKVFRVRDREGTASVPVRYVGAVPDPFREGREVIVTVRKQGDDVRRRARLARHEVPVEVHRRAEHQQT